MKILFPGRCHQDNENTCQNYARFQNRTPTRSAEKGSRAIKALLGAVARQKTRVPLIKHGILTYLDQPIQFFVARIRFYGSNSTINCAKLIFSFFTDFVEILAFKW